MDVVSEENEFKCYDSFKKVYGKNCEDLLIWVFLNNYSTIKTLTKANQAV